VNARSDLYALGAVGYFLVTGQPLFEARNVVEMCGHHLHTTPTPPSRRTDQEVPDDLERIILKCLAKDPSDRYQSAKALQDALAQSAWATPWPDEAAGRWWSVFRASQSRT
jgi:eukaryotic-like serine/threonine-protein kinase